MIQLEWFFWLCAAFFAVSAVMRITDKGDPRRFGSAAFWGLLAFTFVYATFMKTAGAPAWVEGLAVIVMAVLAATGFPAPGRYESTDEVTRERSAARLGNKVLIPALIIPAIAAVFALVDMFHVKVGGQPLLENNRGAIIGLGVGAIVALLVAMRLFGTSMSSGLREGDRLLGHIGWAAILPQLLATLGTLFTLAGVGTAVGQITSAILPRGSLIAAVIVYCVGMVLFTMIMGNAFAAFPVMTAAVGWPLLIQQFGGSPAPVFAVGMLAGFCGTLMTPMAANFNLVPAALLELKDQYGPIKAQIPTALILLVCNIAIIYVIVLARW